MLFDLLVKTSVGYVINYTFVVAFYRIAERIVTDNMENKLNEQFFKTKTKYQNNFSNVKKPFKSKIFNVLITIVLISCYSFIYRSCENRIEKNKRNDVELNQLDDDRYPKHIKQILQTLRPW